LSPGAFQQLGTIIPPFDVEVIQPTIINTCYSQPLVRGN
jgi:hypothetical protein